MACPPGDGAPGKQARADGYPLAKPIGNQSTHGTEKRIHPFELAQHEPPIFIGPNRRNVVHYRGLHRRQHLPIEIIKQGNRQEEANHKPSRPHHGAWGQQLVFVHRDRPNGSRRGLIVLDRDIPRLRKLWPAINTGEGIGLGGFQGRVGFLPLFSKFLTQVARGIPKSPHFERK